MNGVTSGLAFARGYSQLRIVGGFLGVPFMRSRVHRVPVLLVFKVFTAFMVFTDRSR